MSGSRLSRSAAWSSSLINKSVWMSVASPFAVTHFDIVHRFVRKMWFIITLNVPFLELNLERIHVFIIHELQTSTMSMCEKGFATIALLSRFEQNEHGFMS